MPEIINATNITPPRVPLIDQRTGLISREWYRFFLNLFTLTGSGTNQTTLVDLQLGPPPVVSEDIGGIVIDIEGLKQQPTQESALEQIAEINKQLEALASSPEPAIQELVAQVQKEIQALQLTPQPQLGTMAALQQAWLPWVTFDTAPEFTPPTVGTVAWDGGTTLGVQMTANVLGRVNEDAYYYIKASSAITKGDVVMFTGAVGASGVPTGAPATGVTDGSYIMGVAAEAIALNGFGLVQFQGTLKGLNTSAYVDGDILWYNPAVTGGLTKTKPSAPNVKVQMAAVINAGSGGSGSILIRVNAGSVLGGTDSNVQFGTLANNDLIQYDSVAQYWKNVAPSSITVGTATNLAGGATGSVPYQTGPGATTFVGIGTALQVLKVNAGATAPEWVSGAALTKTDDTNVTLTLGGTPATSLLAATSLTLGWSGQLAVSRGGTGVNTTPTDGQLLIGNGTGYTVANVTAGTGISVTNAAGSITITNTSPSSGGTVTSVGLSMPAQFTVTNSPVTSSGTLTAAWNNQTANYVFAGPTTGSAAAPTFRALVAADIPSLPYQPTAAPVTYTANFSVATTDVWIINNKSGSSCTATLPTASSYSGRVLRFQNYQAQTLVSASSNVVPVAGGAAATSILLASAGDQCTLVSDGTNWIMTQYIPNNALLLE